MALNPMKIRVFIGMLFLSSFSFCQQVDSTTINNEKVYIYPFQMPVSKTRMYEMGFNPQSLIKARLNYNDYLSDQRRRNTPNEEILTSEEFDNLVKALSAKNYRQFSKYYSTKFGPEPTKKQFKKYLKNSSGRFDGGKSLMASKKFKEAIRNSPEPFLLQTIPLERDITPMLDPIPDGKYIQYYDEYCKLTKEGECEIVADQIAGYFTIKNNVLEGEAVWVDFVGDTIKTGTFDKGLKVGVWREFQKSIEFFEEFETEIFIESGMVKVDTLTILTSFQNGVENGPYFLYHNLDELAVSGFYLNGEKTGEWKEHWHFTVNEDGFRELGVGVLRSQYTINSDDSLIVHPMLVRSSLFDLWEYDESKYDFYADFEIPQLPNLYEPAFPKTEDLDLSEEGGMGEYEYGMEYDGYYDDYYYNEDWDLESSGSYIIDPTTGEYISRSKIYDSLGAYPKYINTYEVFYPNGQLAYKFELENGLAKSDPTIFWDNGKTHDEVSFIADSNKYERKIYDYQGVLMETISYDSLGTFLYKDSLNDFANGYELVNIDGLTFGDYGYAAFRYSIPDSVLKLGLTGTTVMSKEWNRVDSTVIYEQIFEPISMTGGTRYFNILGEMMGESISSFGADYGSWTGTKTTQFGDFEIRSIRSASLKNWAEVDSIPILMLNRSYAFNVDQDYTLYFEGQPLTGPMEIDFSGKKMKLKQNLMRFPLEEKGDLYMEKVIRNYIENGKVKDRFLLENLPNGIGIYSGFATVYNEIIPLLASRVFSNYEEYGDDYDWEGNPIKSEKRPVPMKIEGYFMDGKPQGEWIQYDQFGKELIVANFEKGELEGVVKRYEYQEPADEYYYYEEEFPDSLPEKSTYYLASEVSYSNGMLNGKAYTYNWLGTVTQEDEFEDGYQNGISIERNQLAVSISEYENGYLDGYSKTYLTLPGRDSILFYDLNFQNGMLQGESKSYHTNGNISKRGFFLSGQPIEDYEGYDSLGLLYHYVKFEYSFPVEEKLWEENELSVKYEFDWQDSIEFIPMNFTESESLDALLVQAGLSEGSEYRPYFGRQTIVDKSDVDYFMTKYYSNDTIARLGNVIEGKKAGHWEHFGYNGEKLYEVNYFDSLIVINDSIKFNSKGMYTGIDAEGNETFCALIIEKSERFDCSHKDHYETRQLYTTWQTDDSVGRMDGLVYNYYDNGTLQSYGKVKNGLPSGEWRYYDPNGKLNKYGNYYQGKRNGRWLSGDLSKTKYLGEICLNPNMPDLEGEIRYRENFLDIQVINYQLGKELNSEYYDINMNEFIEIEEEK